MKQFVTIAGCVVVLFAASQASAWVGFQSQKSGDWSDPTVWIDGFGNGGPGVPNNPGAGAQTYADHVINVDGNYDDIFLIQMQGSSTINVPSGTSVIAGTDGEALSIGAGVGGSTTFNISGGSITLPNGQLTITGCGGCESDLNITSGELTVGTTMVVGRNGKSTIQIDGGFISAATLSWEPTGDKGSTLDITGGQFRLDGDVTAQINGLIDSGDITAFGGAKTVLVDYNNLNAGMTTVTPEPATLGLLAMGSLLMLRRRH